MSMSTDASKHQGRLSCMNAFKMDAGRGLTKLQQALKRDESVEGLTDTACGGTKALCS